MEEGEDISIDLHDNIWTAPKRMERRRRVVLWPGNKNLGADGNAFRVNWLRVTCQPHSLHEELMAAIRHQLLKVDGASNEIGTGVVKITISNVNALRSI